MAADDHLPLLVVAPGDDLTLEDALAMLKSGEVSGIIEMWEVAGNVTCRAYATDADALVKSDWMIRRALDGEQVAP